jgi:hypothetical protein
MVIVGAVHQGELAGQVPLYVVLIVLCYDSTH